MTPLLAFLTLAIAVPDAGTTMLKLLPAKNGAWSPLEPPRRFVRTQIYEYMDGAGEVYLAYHFDTLVVQRYTLVHGEEILVEIFDMKKAQNAFGVSTYMRGRGPAVAIGQDAEYQGGLLTFWRGRYYVCVRVENENPASTEAVLELGRWISKAIGKDGKRPELLQCLPPGSFEPATLRYFFRDEILNTHATLPEASLLRPADDAEGVLARLKRDRSYVLVIRYPRAAAADSAYHRFARGQDSTWEDKGKWIAPLRARNYLVVSAGTPTRERAHEVLTTVRRRLP